MKKLETEEKTKPKTSRRKKIIKIEAEIHKIRNRKTIEKNPQKTKSWIFERSIKFDKPITREKEKTVE